MWRQGRSLPYGEGVSLWALGEMVKAQAGMLETDDAEETEAKLRECGHGASWRTRPTRMARAAISGCSSASRAGDTGRPSRRGEAFAAWRRFFETLAEERPLVLVFEDLHWADDALLDFVDYLVDWASGVPILVVGTARPELLTRRPGWGGGKSNASTLSALAALRRRHGAARARAPGDAGARADTQETLLERAGWKPPVRGGVRPHARRPDGGPASASGDGSGLIAARLDGLAADEKEFCRRWRC